MIFDKTKIIYNLDNLENLLFDSKKETAKEIALELSIKYLQIKKYIMLFVNFLILFYLLKKI